MLLYRNSATGWVAESVDAVVAGIAENMDRSAAVDSSSPRDTGDIHRIFLTINSCRLCPCLLVVFRRRRVWRHLSVRVGSRNCRAVRRSSRGAILRRQAWRRSRVKEFKICDSSLSTSRDITILNYTVATTGRKKRRN